MTRVYDTTALCRHNEIVRIRHLEADIADIERKMEEIKRRLEEKHRRPYWWLYLGANGQTEVVCKKG